jgi:ribosomal protein S18 acetylase RimI-like enzyme
MAVSHTSIEMVVREARPEDSGAIATIHVQAWRAAYQGIVPAQFLEALSVQQREDVWRQRLERDARSTWVVEQHAQVLGWSSVGPSRDADAVPSTSELWAIYVDPRHWRRGVGQHLWAYVQEHLSRSGFSDVTLWVLKDNTGALAFYRSNGFVVDDGIEKTVELGGTELIEIRLRKRLGS